jgi:hypothetical protein
MSGESQVLSIDVRSLEQWQMASRSRGHHLSLTGTPSRSRLLGQVLSVYILVFIVMT